MHSPSETDTQAFLQGALTQALAAFGLAATVELRRREGPGRAGWRARIHPAAAQVAGRRWSQVANALEALAQAALAFRGEGEAPVEVSLATPETAHEAGVVEEPGLVTAARALAQKAVALNRPFALGPMSAVERRLVHQALGEVREVWTQSEGDGIFRRLWVVPRPMMPGRTPAPPRSAEPGSEAPPASGAPHDPSA